MKRIGARVQMSTDAHEVKSADLLVLPDGFDHDRYLQRGFPNASCKQLRHTSSARNPSWPWERVFIY